jgi:hypothetical protein
MLSPNQKYFWAAKANGWWESSMFDDWLIETGGSEEEVKLRNFFIKRDLMIKEEERQEIKAKINEVLQ